MNKITIETTVQASIEKVWECWNEPSHISGWAFASSDWEANGVDNDLKVGGKFKTIMSAKDKSVSFDFEGVYTVVELHSRIEYVMADQRCVDIIFLETDKGVLIQETFDAETENSIEMQRSGWQAILDNFKDYTEGYNK